MNRFGSNILLLAILWVPFSGLFNSPWSELFLYLLPLLALLFLVLNRWKESAWIIIPPGFNALLVFIGLGLMQLIPLPPQLVRILSPEAWQIYQETAGVLQPDAWLPLTAWATQTWQPYVPDALRLLVRNADADPPDESGIANLELPWPTAVDPATFGEATEFGDFRCGVVTGDDADAWFESLSDANQLTRFVAGDHRYQVTVRPLLPDEPPECPSEA